MHLYKIEITLEIDGEANRSAKLLTVVKANSCDLGSISLNIHRLVSDGQSKLIQDHQLWQGDVKKLNLIMGEVPPTEIEPITDRRGAIAAQKARTK